MRKRAILVPDLAFVRPMIFIIMGYGLKMSPTESEDRARKFAREWDNGH